MRQKLSYLGYLILVMLVSSLSFSCGNSDKPVNNNEADIIIYGGTSAAISAAVEAKRSGKSVIVVSPDIHLGGLSSGGLGYTDTGDKSVIGGLARELLPWTVRTGPCGFLNRMWLKRSLRIWWQKIRFE